jgi:hypothetical protein
MKHFIIIVFLAIGTIGCEPHAAEPRQNVSASHPNKTDASSKCASAPCGNTATGEDPQDIAIRNARRARDARSTHSNEKARWKRTLYANATKTQDLELILGSATDLTMRLVPSTGQLQFRREGLADNFEVEQPRGSPNPQCPEYGINVVTAAKEFAVVRKSCMLYEYKPGRFSMGATYYLYDVPSHTIRIVWQSQTSGQDDPFPDPSTEPMVAVLADGIKIEWKATYPAEGKVRSLLMHTRYTRRVVRGEVELVCTDLSVQDGENVEVGACEGGVLKRILLVGH